MQRSPGVELEPHLKLLRLKDGTIAKDCQRRYQYSYAWLTKKMLDELKIKIKTNKLDIDRATSVVLGIILPKVLVSCVLAFL